MLTVALIENNIRYIKGSLDKIWCEFFNLTRMETVDISVFAKWTSFYHFMSSERNRWFLWECLTKCRDSTYARYWMFIQSHWQFWVAATCDLSLHHRIMRHSQPQHERGWAWAWSRGFLVSGGNGTLHTKNKKLF